MSVQGNNPTRCEPIPGTILHTRRLNGCPKETYFIFQIVINSNQVGNLQNGVDDYYDIMLLSLNKKIVSSRLGFEYNSIRDFVLNSIENTYTLNK